jgi:two-component system phosphate regulon sensor histidine kinase PhoR
MRSVARRVWLVTVAAVALFGVYETIKTVLVPDLSIVASHVITVAVAGILTFFVLRYALARYSAALDEAARHVEITNKTNRLLSGVLETMREGVLIVNDKMQVVLSNSAASKMFKLPPGDAPGLGLGAQSGQRSTQAQHPRLVEATRDPVVNRAFVRALEEHTPVELCVEVAGAPRRCFQLSVAPVRNDLAVGVFFDVTDLERLERVRREFFANLSHELRTPLTAILACSETLLAGAFEDPEHRARFVERLHKHARGMAQLISDISDLSAIESGQVTLDLGPAHVRSIIEDVIALAQARHNNPDVAFSVAVPDDLLVNADRSRLEQILYNLIDNAVKFNRPGGAVSIAAEVIGNRAAIHIEDTGVGISEADLPRIFERLYRVDKSRSRKVEGAGLGLAIVKHLVQAHGGEVSATSQPGAGSRFTVILSVAAQRREPS